MSIRDDQDRITSLHEHARRLLAGTGGGEGGDMGDRVTRLETHMAYVRRDLDALKIGQDRTLSKLDDIAIGQSGLPTRKDLQTNIINTVVIGLTILAITLTGIVGGLAVINHYAAAGPATVQGGWVDRASRNNSG